MRGVWRIDILERLHDWSQWEDRDKNIEIQRRDEQEEESRWEECDDNEDKTKDDKSDDEDKTKDDKSVNEHKTSEDKTQRVVITRSRRLGNRIRIWEE